MTDDTQDFIRVDDFTPSPHAPVAAVFRVADIQRIVAQEFGVDPAIMTSNDNRRESTLPRNIALYLCTRFTLVTTLRALGEQFGGRDHSAVSHAVKSVQKLKHSGSVPALQVHHLEAYLEAKQPATPARPGINARRSPDVSPR